MRKEFSASRVLSLFVGVLFFLLSASCGGGGGDDEEDIQTLDSYDFNLSFLDDDPVVVASESGSWIRMEGRGEDSQILGSYDVDGNTITLDEDYGVKASTNIFGFVRATLINLDTDIVYLSPLAEFPDHFFIDLLTGEVAVGAQADDRRGQAAKRL